MQILYVMLFVLCYVLEFLKLLFLLPQVGSRQSVDVRLVVLVYLNTGPGLGMVGCVQRQKQKMKLLSSQSHTEFAVLVQVSIVIFLIRLPLGFIQLSSLGEVMGD